MPCAKLSWQEVSPVVYEQMRWLTGFSKGVNSLDIGTIVEQVDRGLQVTTLSCVVEWGFTPLVPCLDVSTLLYHEIEDFPQPGRELISAQAADELFDIPH